MIHKYLVALSLIAGVAAPLQAQSVHAGIEAWQQGDYSGAVAIWRPLAEKGDADAAFNLGQAYRLGKGVPTNIAAAVTWFTRAAAKGHLDAEANLGLLLFQNGDQPAGLRWLKAAAEKGEPRALLVYGTALVNGDGVPRDPALGYAYVSRAAAQGLAPAKDTLAELDRLLPLETRKKGIAMASAKSKAAPSPSSKPVRTATATAKPIRTAAAKPAPVAKLSLATPQPPVAATGSWRIQLGAFSQRGAAEALYRKVSGSLGGRQAFYIPVGAITRLQVGPYSGRAAAQAACSALKGQACFPIPAK